MESLTMFEASRLAHLEAAPVTQLSGEDRRVLSALQTKVERSAFPVFQALRTLFGDSVDRIECDLPDSWLSQPIGRAYFCIGEQGLMQTVCGASKIVATIPTASGACRFDFALVIKSGARPGDSESLHLVAST